ncbi:MAG TPA: amidohydrolase family protein [Ktedonobacteraceae bacterium]|nr:amidohydrolase family protein [Ktedonobacteraceae bacterium]
MRVDFHTHYIPRHFPDLAAKYGDQGWPTLLHTGLCQAEIYNAGKHYRSIDERSWEPERRIKDMDAEGVDIQVLSPIPVTFAYHFSAQAVLELSQYQNDEIAQAIRVAHERFIGLGTVPLQDPELAAKEVRRAVSELGLAGVEIGTVVEGKNLDEPALEPFWQACEEVGAAIFVHPAAVLAPERINKYRMNYSIGYTTETGIAAATVVMSGLLERHPTLRICFAHGGGTFPWLLPRLDQTWNVFDDVKAETSRKPSEVARLLTYDTLTYDISNVLLLKERVGVDRLVMGTDYPFPLREAPPGIVVDSADTLRPEEREAILGHNALRFLHRSEAVT